MGFRFSIKDIIRELKRSGAYGTEQLKAIIMRTDIDDAKKLEMASALVESGYKSKDFTARTTYL